MYATRVIAARISGRPGPSDDFGPAAIVSDHIGKLDGDLTTGILRGGHTSRIGAGVCGTIQNAIGWASNRWSGGIADRDFLYATDGITTSIGCYPGSQDQTGPTATVTH